LLYSLLHFLRFAAVNLVAMTMRPGKAYYASRRWQTLRNYVMDRDGHRCRVCRRPMGNQLDIDHKRPISQGGSHFTWNLQSLCSTDHAKKHPDNKEMQVRAFRRQPEDFAISIRPFDQNIKPKKRRR
jgi:5-methylcytosine-specific restriction endonuclease McrA